MLLIRLFSCASGTLSWAFKKFNDLRSKQFMRSAKEIPTSQSTKALTMIRLRKQLTQVKFRRNRQLLLRVISQKNAISLSDWVVNCGGQFMFSQTVFWVFCLNFFVQWRSYAKTVCGKVFYQIITMAAALWRSGSLSRIEFV